MTTREWCDSLGMKEGDRRRLWKLMCTSRADGAVACVSTLRNALLVYYHGGVIPFASMMNSLDSLHNIVSLTDRPLPAELREIAGVVPAAGGLEPTPVSLPAGTPLPSDQVIP